MTLTSLETIKEQMRALGVKRLLAKKLAENDNSKQQIYLGGNFQALNLIPFGELSAPCGSESSNMKAPVVLHWMNNEGIAEPAPGAKLILYTKYPEVRLSGFLRGCGTAPADRMRPTPRSGRLHRNQPDGRILLLGIRDAGDVLAFLVDAESPAATEFSAQEAAGRLKQQGVFLEIPPDTEDNRSRLVALLREVHAAGWHDSRRLGADGEESGYAARNAAGYTLEALLGIRPNSRSEPDLLGWELKACGSDRVTLMTPEPDGGFYGDNGVAAFLRQYGRQVRDDTLYFTGMHRIGKRCETTGQTLKIDGFDSATSKITNATGGLCLVDRDGNTSAAWSFQRLIEHWARKHASAAYVPYSKRTNPLQFRYDSPAVLGEGTDFILFLSALANGHIFYDPAPKLEAVSSLRPRAKARSQFRVTRSKLAHLYQSLTEEPLS